MTNNQGKPIGGVYPLLWSDDVERILDWTAETLGLTESWRATGDSGAVEHAELMWPGGRISISFKRAPYMDMGPSGISLRIDDRDQVEALFKRARDSGARILQELQESRVAYSFTALDPDGNQWWVNAETGFLDQLRQRA